MRLLRLHDPETKKGVYSCGLFTYGEVPMASGQAPGPGDDPGVAERWNAMYRTRQQEWRFGFHTEEQMWAWFEGYEHFLARTPIVLAEIEVPDSEVACGEKQAIFYWPAAQIVKETPFALLKPPTVEPIPCRYCGEEVRYREEKKAKCCDGCRWLVEKLRDDVAQAAVCERWSLDIGFWSKPSLLDPLDDF
jgi:hypothetical protein